MLALIPDQSTWLLGSELAVLGVAVTIFCSFALRPHKDADPRLNSFKYTVHADHARALRRADHLRVSLSAEAGGGLYWLAGAFVVGIFACTTNAWVLLVEIKR